MHLKLNDRKSAQALQKKKDLKFDKVDVVFIKCEEHYDIGVKFATAPLNEVRAATWLQEIGCVFTKIVRVKSLKDCTYMDLALKDPEITKKKLLGMSLNFDKTIDVEFSPRKIKSDVTAKFAIEVTNRAAIETWLKSVGCQFQEIGNPDWNSEKVTTYVNIELTNPNDVAALEAKRGLKFNGADVVFRGPKKQRDLCIRMTSDTVTKERVVDWMKKIGCNFTEIVRMDPNPVQHATYVDINLVDPMSYGKWTEMGRVKIDEGIEAEFLLPKEPGSGPKRGGRGARYRDRGAERGGRHETEGGHERGHGRGRGRGRGRGYGRGTDRGRGHAAEDGTPESATLGTVAYNRGATRPYRK